MDSFQANCQGSFIIDTKNMQEAGRHELEKEPTEKADQNAGRAAAFDGLADTRMVSFTDIAADQWLDAFTDGGKGTKYQFLYVQHDAIGDNTNRAAEVHKKIIENQRRRTLIDIPGT